MLEETVKKIDSLNHTYKKLNLMERKKEKMGLYDEEISNLATLKEEYYNQYTDMIDELMKEIIDSVISKKGKKSLEKIQSIVSWNGSKILTIEDFEDILVVSEKLTDKELGCLEENLVSLHADVFKGIENICRDQAKYEALDLIGKTLSNDNNGNIQYLIEYIDDMYKDFGDIFGIELPDIKVFYY